MGDRPITDQSETLGKNTFGKKDGAQFVDNLGDKGLGLDGKNVGDKTTHSEGKKMSPTDKVLFKEEFQKTFEQIFELMTYNLIRDATRGRLDLNVKQTSSKHGGNMGDESNISYNTVSNKDRMGGTGVKRLHKIKTSNNNSKLEADRMDRSIQDNTQVNSVNNNMGNFDFANDNAN